jgi:hypothetical protein
VLMLSVNLCASNALNKPSGTAFFHELLERNEMMMVVVRLEIFHGNCK